MSMSVNGGLDDDLMDDGGDGWDDDDLDLSARGAKQAPAGGPGGSLIAPAQSSGNLEEDFFGSFVDKPAVMRGSGKLTMPAKKVKAVVAVKKLAVEADADDGWDDF
jgi:hypothetical protein